MRISLEVKTGASAGRKIHLQPGQAAQFGGTEWADFSFEDDGQMSEVHFSVEHQADGWHVRDLNSETGTIVNEDPVKDACLHTGDQIVAGRTAFTIQIEGEAAPTAAAIESTGGESADAADGAASDPASEDEADAECDDYLTPPKERSTNELYKYLDYEDDAVQQMACDSKTALAYLEALTAKAKYKEAVRLQAHLLPKRKAIWWGYLCIDSLAGDTLTEDERAAMAATKAWLVKPNETNRRAAGKAGEELNHTGPAAWLATGTFWAGGSMAPLGNPDIPPDERLTGQALSAAMTLAVVRKHPEKPEVAAERFRTILKTGRQVDGDEIELPANDVA